MECRGRGNELVNGGAEGGVEGEAEGKVKVESDGALNFITS